MRAPSALDELKELLAITEQCAEQARVAKQQAQRYAQHHELNAEEYRKLAARSRFPEIQARLLRVAASNERLCNIAEGTDAITPAEVHNVPQEPVTLPHEEAIKRTEDPVSQARRHVAEAEARIARQEALVVRLSNSNKHIRLADQAREILATLTHTLALARDHLALQLRK
jgi:hypothetical protein